MRLWSISMIFLTGLIISCSKQEDDGGCTSIMPVTLHPFTDPEWHPGGQLLGFSHIPVGGMYFMPCDGYLYFGKQDSIGFYLMDKNSSNYKRSTNFLLQMPSWSPDGNWILFSKNSQIYKMRFTGSDLDTAGMIKLTSVGGNLDPVWTEDGDSIFYVAPNIGAGSPDFYTIWKMAGDGTGKQRIVDATNTGSIREPYVGSNGRVYHIRYSYGQSEIFSMYKDGSDVQQHTFNSQNHNRRNPRFFQGSLFYIDNAGLQKSSSSGTENLMAPRAFTYSISTNGEIAYSKPEKPANENDKQKGVLWIMNANGTNNRQLTFNWF